MKLKNTSLAALAAFTIAGSASAATTIYFDSLTGTGTNLNDSTVDSSSTFAGGVSGATWVSGAVTESAGGAIATSGKRAFLPVTIGAGYLYTLTATLSNDATGGNTAWTALGFTKAASTDDNWFQNTPSSAWALMSGNSGGNQAFAGADGAGGSGTANQLAWTSTDGGTQTVTITLDTRTASWSTYATINGVNSASYTYSTNPVITHVGFGTSSLWESAGESTSTVSNFSLTAIPEPSAALLGGLGMLALLRRRRA